MYWIYNKKHKILDCTIHNYWIDLKRCKTSAQILDWIIQISHKNWATNEILGELVKSLDNLLNIQENYCSGGTEQTKKEGV